MRSVRGKFRCRDIYELERSRKRKNRLLVAGIFMLLVVVIFTVGVVLLNEEESQARSPFRPLDSGMAANSFGTVTLFAPVNNVEEGVGLSKVDIEKVSYPRSQVPEGAVFDIDQVRDMYARVSLPAGYPLVMANLTKSHSNQSISARLLPGYRAITIEAQASSVVEGWAAAGAHVDVILTYYDELEDMDQSRIVVEDAVVLSYKGTTSEREEADYDILQSTGALATVTLMVRKENALELQTAKSVGDISLVLRNRDDTAIGGSSSFKAGEWDKRASRKLDSQFGPAKGFASFVTPDGKSKYLILRKNSEIWQSEEE